METKFNFNSQICTTREQSERLLALGLKKETADMCWTQEEDGWGELQWYCRVGTFTQKDAEIGFFDYIPAWSLHRMLSMLPVLIDCKKDLQSYSNQLYLDLFVNCISYTYTDTDYDDRVYQSWGNGLFNAIIDCIEWLIKEGYFNKEYLV